MTTPARLLGRLAVLVAIVGACGSANVTEDSGGVEVADGYGPLAVLPPANGGDDAGAEGSLVITDNCVYLDSMLLAWPSNWVEWDPEAATITFDTSFDEPALLTDGMVLAVGGSTINAEQNWVEPPHGSCDDSEVWGVSGVRIFFDGATDRPDAVADQRRSLPDGVMATSFRPEPLVSVAGELVTVHDRPCLAIRQSDGTETGLVWSRDHISWDGAGLEVPGEPSRYLEVGDEIEVTGDWFDNYANRYDELETETCRADRSIWVADVTGR